MGETIKIQVVNPQTDKTHIVEIDADRLAGLRPGDPLPASAGTKVHAVDVTGYIWNGMVGTRR